MELARGYPLTPKGFALAKGRSAPNGSPTAQYPFEKGYAAGLTLNLIVGSAQTRTRRGAKG